MAAELWGLAIALGVLAGVWLACWLAYRAGKAAGDERMKAACGREFVAGIASEKARVASLLETEESARLATIHENRRQGQLNRHAKHKGEA